MANQCVHLEPAFDPAFGGGDLQRQQHTVENDQVLDDIPMENFGIDGREAQSLTDSIALVKMLPEKTAVVVQASRSPDSPTSLATEA